jgi:anaerobic selenocysteine-containing dehydrogenase
MRTYKTMCPMNCNPTYCGMEVDVEAGQLLAVRGDRANPDSRGFLCVRGQATPEIFDNRRRLLQPLRRVGPRGNDVWEPIGWDEALDQIAGAMRAAGRERVAVWPGHGANANTISRQLVARFANVYGCQFWQPSIICWALGAYGLAITGLLEVHVKEDLGAHAQTVILWGANVASQPSTSPHLLAAKRRGAKIVAIDCRRTESASLADRFLIVRPGTDAALALALLHVIFAEGWHDEAFLAAHAVGGEELAESVRSATPAWAEAITGVPAAEIVDLARLYATNRPATIVLGGSSMFKQRNGWQASRAISCLPAVTGQIGIPGGGLGPRHAATVRGEEYANIGGASSRPPGQYIPSHMPAMTEALANGEIDVLILPGSNILGHFADSGSVERALDRVGLIVCQDLFMSETSRRRADIVLPGTAWLEEVGVKATVSNVYLMDRALEPEGETRSIGDTFRALADRLDLPSFYPWPDQAAAVDALLAGLDGGSVTVDRLRVEEGRYAKQVASVAYADLRFPTPSGKLELYSARCAELGLSPLPVYEEPAETPRSAGDLARRYPLVFRQGRTLTHFHAFYDQGLALPTLARLDPSPRLWINPFDAAERGLRSDDPITIFNQRGDFTATAQVTTDVPPGVVWMRDGWAGLNHLTSGEETMPLAASVALSIPGGQASYEALVEVRSSLAPVTVS